MTLIRRSYYTLSEALEVFAKGFPKQGDAERELDLFLGDHDRDAELVYMASDFGRAHTISPGDWYALLDHDFATSRGRLRKYDAYTSMDGPGIVGEIRIKREKFDELIGLKPMSGEVGTRPRVGRHRIWILGGRPNPVGL